MVGEGSSLPPLTFLQVPGCRSSCYSFGLEPSSGMAAARTTLAAQRRLVESGMRWGHGDLSKLSLSSADTQVPGQALAFTPR